MNISLWFLGVLCLSFGYPVLAFGEREVTVDFLEEFFASEGEPVVNLHRFDNFEFFDQSDLPEDDLLEGEEEPTPLEETLNGVSYYSNPFEKKRYFKERQELINKDEDLEIGLNDEISQLGQVANNIFMFHKKQEIKDGFIDPTSYGPALHYYRGEKFIKDSRTYKMIAKLPKGCDNHIFLFSSVAPEWIVEHITYNDDLYMCFDKNKNLLFTYHKRDNDGCDKYWNVQEARAASKDSEKFDKKLLSYFCLRSARPEYTYLARPGHSRSRIGSMYITATSIVTSSKENYKKFVKESIRASAERRAYCVEYRHKLEPIYNRDGTSTTPFETGEILRDAIKEALKDNPEMFHVRVINTELLVSPEAKVKETIELTNALTEKYPDTFIGFDFVGDEEGSDPWKSHFNEVSKLNRKNAKLFCTCGNTNYVGTKADYNCYDTSLLNCHRLGDTTSCVKHKSLRKKLQQSAIELVPLSNHIQNNVLPMNEYTPRFYTRNGYNIMFGSGAPGFLCTDALSVGLYYFTHTMCSVKNGLGALTKVIRNSIEHSTMSEARKAQYYDLMETHMKNYYREIIKGMY